VTAKKPTAWLPVFKKYLGSVRIQSKDAPSDIEEAGVKLKLWPSQEMVLEQICSGLEADVRKFVILKSRQLGVSTITQAILVFWLALHPHTIGAAVIDNEENREDIRAKIGNIVRSLAPLMGKSFALTRSNRSRMEFSNGSSLDFLVAGKSKKTWGESRGYTVAWLSEVAKYGQESGLASFEATLSEVNPNRLYIFESTAFGPNHWKSMWEEALRDPFTTKAIFVGWWSNPHHVIRETDKRFELYGTAPLTGDEYEMMNIVAKEYGVTITKEQLAWLRWHKSKRTQSEADRAQNQPSFASEAFVESGMSFFQTRVINQMMAERQETIDAHEKAMANLAPGEKPTKHEFGFWAYSFFLGEDFNNSRLVEIDNPTDYNLTTLRIWEDNVDGGEYIIGCDPAFGRNDNKDNHAISIWRAFADKLVQVAEYADYNVDTRQCAWVLAYLAGRYKNCRINIDLTGGPGKVLMQEFQHLRERSRQDYYINRYGDPGDFLSLANWHIYRRPDAPGPGYAYNTMVSHDIKFRMMNQLRDSFVTNQLRVRSRALLKEMSDVRQEGSDISASGRNKDDRVFAAALANMTWIENVRGGLIAQGITWEGHEQRVAGKMSPIAELLNRRTYALFTSINEQAADPPPPPVTFMEARGLE